MVLTVVYCEKPAAARAAAEVLGRLPGQPNSGAIATKKGIVTHGIGHLIRKKMPEEVDPAMQSWDRVAVTLDPIPSTPIEATRGQLNRVVALLGKADLVLLAADVGREGELIGYEVFEYAGYRGQIKRILLKNLEASAIREAFANPVPAHQTYPWYLEALARQEHDYWRGLSSTRGATTKLRPKEAGRGVWATGPVKGPALALICEREIAIERHVPEDYRVLWLDVAAGDGRSARLRYPAAGKPILKDIEFSETILKAARSASGPLQVSGKLERVAPPQPFNTDAFLRKMGATYNLPTQRAFKALQELYDAGYTTYPRTPARTWAMAQSAAAGEILAGLARIPDLKAAGLAAVDPIIRKGSRYAAAKEHDALSPTRKIPNLAQLSPDQKAAYLCIVRNFIANHLPDAEDHKTRLALDVPVQGKDVTFTATGSVEKSPGWRVAFGGGRGAREEGAEEVPLGKGKAEAEDAGRLPEFRDGEPVSATRASADNKQTEPPPRFAEAEIPTMLARLIDLVEEPALKAALENPDDPSQPKGLGTPATRKDVGPELLALGYLEKTGKAVRPTSRGFALYFAHKQHPLLAKEMEPVSRAQLEHSLTEIGSAGSVQEAERRLSSFRRRSLDETRALAAAYESARPFSVDLVPEDLRGLVSGLGDKVVSAKQRKLVNDIAKQKGIKVSKTMLADPEAVRAFLDEHAPMREKGARAADGPPTERQLAAIGKFADRNRANEDWDPDKRSPGWQTSAKAASTYLDWAVKTAKASQQSQSGQSRTGSGKAVSGDGVHRWAGRQGGRSERSSASSSGAARSGSGQSGPGRSGSGKGGSSRNRGAER